MEDWIDRQAYPFDPHHFDLPAGRMHYVDEGGGDPVVMVHGNPTWSFLYRHLIQGLSGKYRCIAPDHLGFGLSDKPLDWSYLPRDHAGNLDQLITKLDLKDITLVVQDWGGPIGLSYALDHPGNVRRIVLMNTWMWPVNGDPHYEKFSGVMGGAMGRFLIRHFNFFARVVMKQAMGDKTKLTRPVHRHYLQALDTPDSRKGCWIFPKQIIGSGPWLESLWSRRETLKPIPALILWGMKDIAFREKELQRWTGLFTDPRVIRFGDTGHFVPEEEAGDLCPLVDAFLEGRTPITKR